jgi:hypothetical protein
MEDSVNGRCTMARLMLFIGLVFPAVVAMAYDRNTHEVEGETRSIKFRRKITGVNLGRLYTVNIVNAIGDMTISLMLIFVN